MRTDGPCEGDSVTESSLDGTGVLKRSDRFRLSTTIEGYPPEFQAAYGTSSGTSVEVACLYGR
jgi:hypothetical protein